CLEWCDLPHKSAQIIAGGDSKTLDLTRTYGQFGAWRPRRTRRHPRARRMRNDSLQGDHSGENKMTRRTLLFALLASFLSLTLHAAPAVVEAVQYPAWLERDGRSVPLTPGTVLHSNDQLRTGNNARVQLKL